MGTITDRQLQAKAGAKDTWFVEEGPRGAGRFIARITKRGERLFYYRYTDSAGNRDRLPIGSYDPRGTPGMTVKEARAKADEWAKLYLAGNHDLREYLIGVRAEAAAVSAEAQRQAEETRAQAEIERQRRLTVCQLFDRWKEVELKSHVRPDGSRAGRKDGGQYVQEQFQRHIFATFGAIPAAEVRKSDVLVVLDALRSAGKLRTCNLLLAHLKQMLRFAVTREIIPHNPLESVTKRDAGGADVERDRFLTVDEIAALSRQIPEAKLSPRSVAAIWLIIATGCRVGELLGAKWADIDLQARSWHLPETKNERPHTIHLSDFAVGHFTVLLTLCEGDRTGAPKPWVFPNATGTGPIDPKSLGKQLADRQKPADKKFQRRTKRTQALALPGGRWTAHDLRRTAATLMARLGVSTDVIDECLNHKLQSRVSRVYIRDRRESEQAQAFDTLGTRLAEIISGTERSNVVPLRGAA